MDGFHKDAYDYRNYFSADMKGSKAKVLSPSWYIQESYTPFVSAYDLFYNQKPMPELEDPLELKSVRYRDRIDLIIDDLGRREKVKYDNLCRIHDCDHRFNFHPIPSI